MDEKINGQKILNYVPSLLMKLILDNPLKDKDVFCDSNKNKSSLNHLFNHNSSKSLSSFVNPDIYPIQNELPSTLIMIIKLGGFYKLISTLSLKDQKNQKEKLISEYLSIITPKILLKISAIISENGGEIIKYNDYELMALWINSNNKNSKYYNIYNKFNAKLGLITAIELLKKVDKTEISRGVELELSIGISLGDISCNFFGGERKRAEYVFYGEGIDNAQLCLLNCLPHEIIIDKELNEVFKKGGEITTMEIEENKNIFSLIGYIVEELRDFNNFKGIKMRNINIIRNKNFYENLEKKTNIVSSVVPSGLLKYINLGEDTNTQEINILTIETIVIYLENEIIKDLKEIQNIIFDIQKAIYLSFGILIHISKMHTGLLIRAVWGIDPSTFIDDTARAISTASIIGNLTKYYKMKIGIGITTGACFSGLVCLQGNKKVYTLLGKKVILSRLLAEEACRRAYNDNDLKYIIYCDKPTVKYSQKWYRHIFVCQLKIYLTKKNDIFDKYKIEFNDGKTEDKAIKQIQFDKNISLENSNIDQNNILKDEFKLKSEDFNIKNDNNNDEFAFDIETKNDEEYKKIKNKIFFINEYNLINEIYSPIEDEEYFIPNYYDPFPLIRTHLNNSFSSKNRLYFRNILHISNNENISKSKIPKIRVHSMRPLSIHKAQSHIKMILKLRKSQTIFGQSLLIKKICNILNHSYKNNKRQFFLIKGPLGIGKTLLLRKCLNDFIGSNDFLGRNYFQSEQFLFCNMVKPLNNVLPFNTVNYILREIFLNIKKLDKIKELYQSIKSIKLTKESFKNISFILSLGKNDINLEDEFSQYILDIIIEKEDNSNIIEKRRMSRAKKDKSFVRSLEGPFDFKDKYKLYEFFFNMIILYKKSLDEKKKDNIIINLYEREKNHKKALNKIPLILVIDDLQFSDDYSIEFIQYLFNNDKPELKPFFVILLEQTPFNEKFSPLIHRNLENFLIFTSEESDKPKEDKIIKFTMKPLMEKNDLQKLIIFNNREAVMKKYMTNLESVDEQILDFLLMKTFNGIPLLALSLFDSLIKTEKFIQKLSGEFIITSELIDDNIVHDWSDLLLPYIYEKIDSMMINSLLSYQEIMLLKYASIIGNIFDLKTLEKLNSMKTIKVKEMEKILIKLNNEYLLEIYYRDVENKNDKIQNIVCQLTFPLLREILHQKFPMERRAILHMKTSKILSTSKRNTYFSIENELKIFKRHLLYSEMNIINEIESKDIKTVQDILQNKMVLNFNNLKLYVVKEIFSKYYSKYNGKLIEGNLEMLFNNKWLKISYYIDKGANIYINFNNPKKVDDEIIMTIPIKTIYKNVILSNNNSIKMKSNNMLAIYQSLAEDPFAMNKKKMILFSSEQREEICKLDISINFLRVKVNYDKYISSFIKFQLPLYKVKWYRKKKLLIYSNIEQNGITIDNVNSNHLININSIRYSISFKKGTIINQTKEAKSSFDIIFKSTFGIFLGKIQERLTKIDERKHRFNNNYNKGLSTPNHLSKKINNFLKSSCNIVNKSMNRMNSIGYRKSMCITNVTAFHRDFILGSDFQELDNKKEENKIETIETSKRENKNEELFEIKETPKKNKKIKKKKKKIKKEKNKGNNIVKDIKKEFPKKIDEKNKEENSIIKINYLTTEENIDNHKKIDNKDDESDDICLNEFNLEDDDDSINLSINNIKTTFNLLNYKTTCESDEKTNFSDK